MQVVILEGRAHERIVEFARDFDLTVLSSHGKDGMSAGVWQRHPEGIVAVGWFYATRSSAPTRRQQPQRIPLPAIARPLDGSWRAESVLPLAATLAQSCAAELQIAHIVNRPEMPRRLPPTKDDLKLSHRVTESNHEAAARYLEQLRSTLPVQPQIRLINGESVMDSLQCLVEQERADLVVLCAHGYSGDGRRTYGSVATNLITYGTRLCSSCRTCRHHLAHPLPVKPPRFHEVPKHTS